MYLSRSSSGRVVATGVIALALCTVLRAQFAFSTSFIGGTTQQQTATTAALNSIAGYFTNNITLNVSVTITDLGNTGTLGDSSANFSAINGVYYATPLYNVLTNTDLTGQNTSITIRMNNNNSVTWGYAASAPGAGAYSWQSVVMHEILHSMGFYDGVADNTGALSNAGYTIFDTLSYYGAGANTAGGGTQFSSIGTSAANNGTRLGAITSDNMYWQGANGKAANGGNPVKLYAPTTYASGSTYSHIDPSQTNAGGLLFPSLADNTYYSGPTAVELGIMRDLGWSAIPEPATVALWLGGTGWFAVIIVRRRKAVA